MAYNLVLVGTGFASSFFLKKYLEKSKDDVKVLVLERGKFIPHKQRLEKAAATPLGRVGYVSGGEGQGPLFINNNKDKAWIFDPSFGGSSNCWTGCTPRFMPNDFRMKTKYGVGIDWPIQYDEIEPYYCETEDIMSISGPSATPYPMSKPYPQPAHQLSTADKVLQKTYGDMYISQPTARSSVHGKRNKCCTSAVCHLCPVSAKFTIENGLGDIYKDPRVEVRYECQVLRFETTNDSIQSVVFTNNGKEEKITAEVFGLGANAIFNAHVLLNSGDTSAATGKYLSEQIGYYCYVYLDKLSNVGGSSIITANGFMLYDNVDRSKMAACIIESHNDIFLRSEYGKWRDIMKLKFVFEDIPQVDNVVKLSDKTGVPVADYKSHSDYVKNGYENLKKNIDSLLSPLPVENIFLDENPQVSEAHILGTTRMSDDANDGVVDKQLKHHRYRNLFVLGGSVFPTITPGNPTLTLSALSLYAADKNF
ncbi:MAG: GMC oxidoreductase [Bacteroidota bacterium]